MRRYWLPALLAEEVAECDGTPVRVRLLGEDLVAFRDSSGRIGMLAAACPHRLASLALGRNEEGGLRCIYHGWKFGADGACIDMPTEPEGYNFKDRLSTRAYPVREAGGIVWTYLGPSELLPPFPAFDWTNQPREQIATAKYLQGTNYLQMAEGAIDSAHTRFLHRGSNESNEAARRESVSRDLAPRLEVADTCYGFRYAAIRRPNENADTMRYVKETRYVFPSTAVTSGPLERDNAALTQIFVPVDDEHTMHYSIWHSLVGKPVDQQRYRRKNRMVPGDHLDARWRPHLNRDNWYQQDRASMRAGSWTGIPSLMLQDAAVQETMGALIDHDREHLGTSDVAIIRLRRRMLESVQRFIDGGAPIGLDTPFDYAHLTHIDQALIGIDEPWENVSTFPGEYASRESMAVSS